MNEHIRQYIDTLHVRQVSARKKQDCRSRRRSGGNGRDD